MNHKKLLRLYRKETRTGLLNVAADLARLSLEWWPAARRITRPVFVGIRR